MAETKIYINDETDRLLRETAMRRFGYGRGSISKAVEEAVSQWLMRNRRIERAIEEIVAHAKKDSDVLGVVIFGSYAKKKPDYHDVDICILLRGTTGHSGKLMEYGGLFSNDDRLFDISILNDLPLDIKVDVLNNGTFVYARDPDAVYDYAAKVIQEWSDFAPRLKIMVGR